MAREGDEQAHRCVHFPHESLRPVGELVKARTGGLDDDRGLRHVGVPVAASSVKASADEASFL